MKVFGCEECTDIVHFRRPPHGGPFYKFPPVIGAQGNAPLLFIGINPRRSHTNRCLHDWLVNSPGAFEQLAKNRDQNAEPYIAPDGPEEHYRCHAIVVEEVFAKGSAFESSAAATELFLCASKGMPVSFDTLKRKPCVCAARYLLDVIKLVQPRVIVSVGDTVNEHLAQHFSNMISVPIVFMQHPKYLYGMSTSEKVRRLQPTINKLRERFSGLISGRT
jgi:hypothetical protein